MKILVVEDDEFLTKIYKMTLNQEGHSVTTTKDGYEGLKALKENKPDIILLDLLLPQKDGFEFLKEVKEDKKFKNIPVLILTNLGQESDVKKAKALGADDYIIKANVEIEDVIKKVNKYGKKKK